MCAPCPTPRLNQSYKLRPPWEQHLIHVPHRVRNGYNSTVASDVIMCRLAALLANQQQLAEALAYIQKLFQLTVSEADG